VVGRGARSQRRGVAAFVAGAGALLLSARARADNAGLPPHATVAGKPIMAVEVAEGDHPDGAGRFVATDWSSLAQTRTARGPRIVRIRVPTEPLALPRALAGDPIASAVEIPACAGRGKVWLNGHETPTEPGPVILRLPASTPAGGPVIDVAIAVGDYEQRIPCGAPAVAGVTTWTREGLGVLEYPSLHRRDGGGRAVVFVPPGHDPSKPAAVLVGLHPWNGTMWTYAAYAELLREAAAKDVVLLLPSALGNSLYTAAAEEEVLLATRALEGRLAVDRRRVSIWGASMGGAGATTIGFHHPDRFASVTSLFGDSKYDLATYVRPILRDEEGAHRVNALDVVDNARDLPVWLIHGEADKVSPIRQSVLLADALKARGFSVRFDRMPGAGHEGALVARFAAEIVDRASSALVPESVSRVTFTSLGPGAVDAYGVHLVRTAPEGDATVDVAREGSAVHVHRADRVASIRIARGSFGMPREDPPPIAVDPGITAHVAWDPPARGASGN
jgi:pimeloyl-ACP methyl ester carboxylesterase